MLKNNQVVIQTISKGEAAHPMYLRVYEAMKSLFFQV